MKDSVAKGGGTNPIGSFTPEILGKPQEQGAYSGAGGQQGDSCALAKIALCQSGSSQPAPRSLFTRHAIRILGTGLARKAQAIAFQVEVCQNQMAKGVSFSSDTRFRSKLAGQNQNEESEGSQSDDESESDDTEERQEASAAAAVAAAAAAEQHHQQLSKKLKQQKKKKKPDDPAKRHLRSSSQRQQQHHHHKVQRSFSLVPERLGRGGLGGSMQSQRHMQICEAIMKVLIVALIAVTFPFSFIFCLKVIAQYERAVILRFGRILSTEASGPGLLFTMPCMDSVKCVDLRTMTFDVPTQEVLTKDSVTVAVDAVVYYRIFDPVMSVVNVEDSNRSTKLLAQTTLRNVLGTVSLYELLAGRDESALVMQETLDAATDTWGVKVERVEIKDVRLPLQLQRAMAAEAEAAREARAKVIAAEGEEKASKALKAAAIELSECNVALQLRYLQTLSSISAEKNSTIIFPLPIELLKYFQQIPTDVGEPDEFLGQSGETKSGADVSAGGGGSSAGPDGQKPPPPPPSYPTMSRGPDTGSKTSFGSGC